MPLRHYRRLVILLVVLSAGAVCQQTTVPSSPPSAPVPSTRIRQTPVLGPLGVSCKDEKVDLYGKITFFARHAGVAYGISTRTTKLEDDEDLRVYLWVSNQSNRSVEQYVCCGLPLLEQIQVVDSTGKRLVSSYEMLRNSTKAPPEVCSCSYGAVVEPGTCRVIDSGVVNGFHGNGFRMPPGTYTIIEDPEPPHALPETPVYPKLPPEQERLMITILPSSEALPNK